MKLDLNQIVVSSFDIPPQTDTGNVISSCIPEDCTTNQNGTFQDNQQF